MLEKPTIKKPNPHLISVRIPDWLYEKLEAKSVELHSENISETIRFLLESTLENPRVDKSLNFSILSYLMIRESLVSLVEDGDKLINRVETKAKKIMEDFKLNAK